MQPSHPAVVENQPHSTPRFSIDVEEQIFKRLSKLAKMEGISINAIGSELIKIMLLLHRSELKLIIDTIKRRNHHATP